MCYYIPAMEITISYRDIENIDLKSVFYTQYLSERHYEKMIEIDEKSITDIKNSIIKVKKDQCGDEGCSYFVVHSFIDTSYDTIYNDVVEFWERYMLNRKIETVEISERENPLFGFVLYDENNRVYKDIFNENNIFGLLRSRYKDDPKSIFGSISFSEERYAYNLVREFNTFYLRFTTTFNDEKHVIERLVVIEHVLAC